MYTCAGCTLRSCEKGRGETLPKNCPMRDEKKLESFLDEYRGELQKFYLASAEVEAEGYCQWPRLRETIEFCKKMGYRRIGLAFCGGLSKEGRTTEAIFRRHGFDVVSVVCKVGGFDKSVAGIPDEGKLRPGEFEPMCNPVTQAELLNEQETDFNVALGLCVGHDSMFFKYSKAMATALVAKDRVLGHNPCAAIYTADTYCKSKL